MSIQDIIGLSIVALVIVWALFYKGSGGGGIVYGGGGRGVGCGGGD